MAKHIIDIITDIQKITWEDVGEFINRKSARALLGVKTYTLFANFLSWHKYGNWKFIKKNKFTPKGGVFRTYFLEDEDRLPINPSKEEIIAVTKSRGTHTKDELNKAAKERAEIIVQSLMKNFGLLAEIIPVKNKLEPSMPLLLRPFGEKRDGYMVVIKDAGDNFSKIKQNIEYERENGTVYRKMSLWNTLGDNPTYPGKKREK